jgi:Xaa-Pro aminopeptidase
MLYLAGFNEPDSCLAIERKDGCITSRLFVKENDEHSLLWSGPTTGSENAAKYFGVDSGHSIDALPGFIQEAIDSRKLIYHDVDENSKTAKTVLASLSEHGRSANSFLHELRSKKRQAEISVIKDASNNAAAAFKETMQFSRKTRFEAHLAAKMEYECRLLGAEGLAYVPVIAGGSRANILHYTRNNMIIPEDKMVLMDAGGKFNGYCTDTSRTWPVNGRFTAAQKELYEAVLRVQEACIQVCKLDQSYQISLLALNHLSVELMAEELAKLGFSNPKKVVHKLYPHSIGHYLGLDLHDCPKARQDTTLQPVTVLTIEPGLYIPEDPQYPEKFHGIGIRIEDDVLIETQSNGGCTVLTQNVPKHVDAIECLLNTSCKS